MRKMNRFLKWSLMVFLCVLLVLPVMLQMSNAFADNSDDKTYIYDMAGIYSSEDKSVLSQKCQEVSKKVEIDFVITTTNDTNYTGYVKYADDFMDKNGLGYEDDGRWDKSCVMLLLDFDNQEVYIDTTGFAILCIEDDDIEDILDDIFVYIPDKDYYNASLAFIDSTYRVIVDNKASYADEYLDEWKNFDGTYASFENTYINVTHNAFYRFKKPYVSLFSAMIIAGIVVLIMASGNKSKMTADRRTYMNGRNVRMHFMQDQFLRTTTTRRRINTGSGGSGHHGGSHHSSGGGHSHGGGGRHM
ncbi:MAG: TPM domain-containing protein [Lachnospiraceae bacterium]|nr:TPM domain-containing protein [Lachnospiraceae bacterium]